MGKLSDHLPVFTCLDIFTSNKVRTKYITIQEKSKNAFNSFSQYIHNTIDSTKFDSDLISDPNVNYHKLEKILLEGNKLCFPKKQKRFDKYKDKLNPWITKGIMRSMKFRDNLYKKLKATPEDSAVYTTLKINLKNYNKILQKMIRCAKFSYHNDIFIK